MAIRSYVAEATISVSIAISREADHGAHMWTRDLYDEKAVLCGGGAAELTIREYLEGRQLVRDTNRPIIYI